MRTFFLLTAAIVYLTVSGPRTVADNSVLVESKVVAPGATGVQIGVYVTNQSDLVVFTLPLEFRSITPGAYITNAFEFAVQGRVAAASWDLANGVRYFSDPDLDNSCSGPVSQTYSVDDTPAGFFDSPDAVFWYGQAIWNGMGSGTDGSPGAGSPSFVFTFDVTDNVGIFEIDTCCVPPNHLLYYSGGSVVPSFTKGVIQIGYLKSDFAGTPQCGSSPLTVEFTDLSSGIDSASSWDWDFGDGFTSHEQNPTHEYSTAGVYDVSLQVSGDSSTDSHTKETFIIVDNNLVAGFVAYQNEGHAPLTVFFESTQSGFANSYLYEFGDGDTSNHPNPIHIYDTQGSYDVKIRVSLDLDGCQQQDSVTRVGYVYIPILVADFTASPRTSIDYPFAVEFTDMTIGTPTSWYWDFGDGHTSDEPNPIHTYTSPDTFDVFMKVDDGYGPDSILALSAIQYISVCDVWTDLWAYFTPESLRHEIFLTTSWDNNNSTTPAENCTLRVSWPSGFDYVGASGLPDNGVYHSVWPESDSSVAFDLGSVYRVGHTIWNYRRWWSINNGYGARIQIHVPVYVPCGTPLSFVSAISTTSPEKARYNNTVTLIAIAPCSWDPNDKIAFPDGDGPDNEIPPGQRLTYRIDFDNKAEATAPAYYILVIDSLDQDLDWRTLAEGPSSHPENCELSFDPYTGVITYFCDGILLPPNVDPPEGEGYFTFSVMTPRDLPGGTEISNRAAIRFDDNEWILAPEAGPVVRRIITDFCDCGNYCDVDGVPGFTPIDVVYIVNFVYRQLDARPLLNYCPTQNGDWNCDNLINPVDVVYYVNYVYKSAGEGPCDPCQM